jgi:hypothetical protein
MYNMKVFGYKINIIIIIIFLSISIILVSHTYYGCNDPYALIEGVETYTKNLTHLTNKEAFTAANTNYGQSSSYDLSINNPVDTSSWMAPNMTVTPGQKLNPAVKKFLDRPKQTLPLPEGEMDLFYNTKFSPECCPNTYSNSKGCACMTGDQYNYLIQRGNNNVPYSEY